MTEQMLQVIIAENTQESIIKMLDKLIGNKSHRRSGKPSTTVIDIYCPLWIITVRASFKRFLLRDYRIMSGVAVDGWTHQAGSIGTLPGYNEISIPEEKVLANTCPQSTAETKSEEFLSDALTLKYRSVPKLDFINSLQVFQPVWLGKYMDKKDQQKFIFVDGVSGRQLYRYDNMIDELAATVTAVSTFIRQ